MQDQNWDDARIFLAAYRLGGLGLAAGRLGVDTSTVSRRLAAFEARLGVPLFERTREGLRRTRAAEQLFEAAEAMEAAHARLARDASDVEASAEGTVRLTVDPGLAEFFIAPALPRLRAKHPRLVLELDASALPRDLARREADLALRSTAVTGAELVTTRISVAPWQPAGAPALVAELGPLASFADAPWLAWDHDMAGFAPARWLARHAAKAKIPLRTSHFASQLAAAVAGVGLALVPEPFVARLGLARVRTTRALAAVALPRTELWLIAPRPLRDVPRVAAVWTFLVDELRPRRVR
jgi:DNA-binding transcriptional LysR family regulator